MAGASEPSSEPGTTAYGNFGRSLSGATPNHAALFGLIIMNLLVFGLMVSQGVSAEEPSTDSLVQWGANFGPKTVNGQWWRLITYQFVHAGWFHLAVNMFSLLSIGLLCQALVGNIGFVILYLTTGAIGGIVRLYWDPYVTSVGASGSVFGVAGALLGFVALRVDSIPREVRGKIMQDMMIFAGINAYYAFKNPEGVDHAAHIGGFLSGLVCGLILSQPLPIQVDRRARRNWIVAGLGVAAMVLAVVLAPKLTEIESDVTFVLEIEPRVMEFHRELARDLTEGRISGTQLADLIETEVLPQWSDARSRLGRLVDAPYGNKELFERFHSYFQLREESFRLQVEGLRKNDDGISKQAFEKWSEADEAATQLLNAQLDTQPGKGK